MLPLVRWSGGRGPVVQSCKTKESVNEVATIQKAVSKEGSCCLVAVSVHTGATAVLQVMPGGKLTRAFALIVGGFQRKGAMVSGVIP
eukprot:6000685-Amphidinium_carterae.1